MVRTVFTSKRSFQDAQNKARVYRYKVIGKARNRKGEYVVFARSK